MLRRPVKLNPLLALCALLAMSAIAAALWHLEAAGDSVVVTPVDIGEIPARIYRPRSGGSHPVVVIAHGFAGSQQLMQSFALTFAHDGYIAVTFDFPGHGRNRSPLRGSITDAGGATQALVEATRRVADYARGLGDGRLAVLGHSMASDVVIRYAETAPNVGATITVSMFSPMVTAAAPANLLVIVGDWEGMLKREALKAVALASAPAPPAAGITYGSPAAGTGRRAAFSPQTEHLSVLYSRDSMREALDWLDRSFGTVRTQPPWLDHRGPWILLLVAGVVLLARPLTTLLPRLAVPALGARRTWRGLRLPLLLPPIATPLLLRVLPTHFLPVLVGDYLAMHFALYGLSTLLCMAATARATGAATGTGTANSSDIAASATSSASGTASGTAFRTSAEPAGAAATPTAVNGVALACTSLAVVAFGFLALVWPIDRYFTSFIPGPQRFVLILAMLVGTTIFFLGDEWLTRGGARGAYAASKLLFLISLALAVALDPYRLFFLVIIIPEILLFFFIYGLFSAWVYRRTGHPFVAGIASAVAFAWAIGVTFPLLTG
jgi:dienelactone hydrolase